MTNESITGILLMVALIVYLATQIIRTILNHSSFSPIPFILIILGILFALLLTYRGNELKASDLAQILLTMGLVLVTAVYAWLSEKAVKAAKEQADANVKMAEEMREQRYTESMPILILDVRSHFAIGNAKPNEIDYSILQTGIGLEVIWHNLGKGIAINSQFSFWSVPLDIHPDKTLYFTSLESSFLEIGGYKQIRISDSWNNKWVDSSKVTNPKLVAEYYDIYERKISTIQEFRIENLNGVHKPFLGEIYLTINGKKLGENILNND